MNRPHPVRLFLVPALLLSLTLAACDSASDTSSLEDETLARLSASLAEELNLTASQEASLGVSYDSLDRHGRTPGFLWELAAEYQATLTDEQKAALYERTEELEEGFSFRGLFGFPGAGGFYGAGGLFFGGSHRHGYSAADSVLALTDDQQTALEEIHTRYRASMRGLLDAFQAGSLTEGDFVAQMIALRTAKQQEIDAILTNEQRAALETLRAEREAEFEAYRAEVIAVRNEVLDLTIEQANTMDALYEDQLSAREALYDQLAAGSITVADFRAAVEDLEAARLAELEALLDDIQFEIVQIHDALTVRGSGMGHRAGKGGPGGRGGKGPGGKGHGFGAGAWGDRNG